MRIVFLGTGEIGAPSLRALVAQGGFTVAGVFTQPDRPAGRDLRLRPSPIKQVALELGLPVFQPEKIRAPEALEQLRALAPEVIVVIAYGQILPRAVLDLPPRGCLNVHASLLPRHRGASPIQAAIREGDAETGVTIMHMDVGLDTGDMILKAVTPIGRHETGGRLHDRLAQLAPASLLEALQLIREGRAPREKQDDALATYAAKLSRDDGRIDWTRSARQIDCLIRAFTPWPGAFTTFPHQGQEVVMKVHQAALVRRAHGEPGVLLKAGSRGLLVGAGEGAILLREVQVPGGKRLSAADFWRGRPLPVGTRLG